MDTPTRRTLLTGSAGTLALLAAGCLDDGATSGNDAGPNGEDDSSNEDGAGDGEEPRDDRLTEEPRVDEPPHEIDSPEPPEDDPDEWNDHYLGEHIETEPTLEFEAIHGVSLEEPTLAGGFEVEPSSEDAAGNDSASDGDEQGADDSVTDPAEEPPTNAPSESEPEPAPVDGEFAVHLLEDDDDLTDVSFDRADEDGRTVLEAVDFDEQVVVVVESGWGSSSVRHQWVRVEEPDDDGAIDLHGYYTDPQVQTHDYTTRHSAVVVDRPDEDVAFARIRLTVSEDHRVNVNSTEGLVSLEREE
ncbi:hypothetical protein [Natrarchaeobaculum aegyptiacum]|uniref:Uncharacterized protein n=1 Tax=Natrarchaeobaculum aegyptiacum TaxID=745377 RepID=A0A2Z2HW56_9EURY|nr:hypothetical protein [Natrarchaeobaculum aegyptiacum]ARS91549.1 hypothetical protein B1756_18690 [Natrarchaeobaculum aegyptiacum]